MEGDTAGDEHRRRHAGQQPPGRRSAVTGITTPADDVKDRLIRHNANVPARPWFSGVGPDPLGRVGVQDEQAAYLAVRVEATRPARTVQAYARAE